MKKLFLVLALVGLACAAGAQGLVDRKAIDVDIRGGKVVVDEQEAHTTAREGALRWLVPSGYTFADDGIVIDSKGKHRCALGVGGRTFRCVKLGHIKGDKYKYTVKVLDSKGKALDPLDPFIMND